MFANGTQWNIYGELRKFVFVVRGFGINVAIRLLVSTVAIARF
jgi:hypothetical protein